VGSAYERAVRDYLQLAGYACQRTYGAGRPDDQGDLLLWERPDLLLSCKAQKAYDLAGWLTEAQAAAARDQRTALVVVKRRQMAVQRSYVVTDLRSFITLLEAP
jgi:hypothetical protein